MTKFYQWFKGSFSVWAGAIFVRFFISGKLCTRIISLMMFHEQEKDSWFLKLDGRINIIAFRKLIFEGWYVDFLVEFIALSISDCK